MVRQSPESLPTFNHILNIFKSYIALREKKNMKNIPLDPKVFSVARKGIQPILTANQTQNPIKWSIWVGIWDFSTPGSNISVESRDVGYMIILSWSDGIIHINRVPWNRSTRPTESSLWNPAKSTGVLCKFEQAKKTMAKFT